MSSEQNKTSSDSSIAAAGLIFNEPVVFELGSPGRKAYSLPSCDVPEVELEALLPADEIRDPIDELPELTELDVVRHYTRLSQWNFSIDTNFYPLGSCTMKYNPKINETLARLPGFAGHHPMCADEDSQGSLQLMHELQECLKEISGMDHVSLQPAAGAQGEFAGMLMIQAYLTAKGNSRKKVLLPDSAHGTNPASAVMAGMTVVVVACDESGNIDVDDLAAKAEAHASELAAFMVTYPSTHGVFETRIREICDIVHRHGGRVYLDGANLNAQVGLCRPGDYGADVCHINLHKTFAIPHGGGGPGMGPICVTDELAPFLPGHPEVATGGEQGIEAVSAAPWGSGSILLISWAYIALLGKDGVRRATEIAILNANYMAMRLGERFDILYQGENGRVAHEFILDLRPLRKTSGITDEDVAKRLMDYGFHAPTMSFPVVGTVMVEPTESESKYELDRFCDALFAIRDEIEAIVSGEADREDNALKNAPHTAAMLMADEWEHGYSREQAAFPAPWSREHKYWPPVRRVDNAYGDRNLVCACPPVEAYAERAATSE